jgi:hypothetical protein
MNQQAAVSNLSRRLFRLIGPATGLRAGVMGASTGHDDSNKPLSALEIRLECLVEFIKGHLAAVQLTIDEKSRG